MRTLLLTCGLIVPLAFATAGPAAAQAQGGAAQAKPPEPTRTAASVITVTACVQRETEYRAQVKDGRGGVAGTGLGADNEVVLHSIRTVSNETLAPTATPGIGPDAVYSVTGDLEREIARAVGRQVAVSGYVEIARTDGTAKVEDLPRFNAAGWHVVAERCPAAAPRRR